MILWIPNKIITLKSEYLQGTSGGLVNRVNVVFVTSSKCIFCLKNICIMICVTPTYIFFYRWLRKTCHIKMHWKLFKIIMWSSLHSWRGVVHTPFFIQSKYWNNYVYKNNLLMFRRVRFFLLLVDKNQKHILLDRSGDPSTIPKPVHTNSSLYCPLPWRSVHLAFCLYSDFIIP